MGNYIGTKVAAVKDRIMPHVQDDTLNSLKDNPKMEELMNFYRFSILDIERFFRIFRKLDHLGRGYIDLDSFYTLTGEEISSIITPYLERFYFLIEKESEDRLNFFEWLNGVSALNLMVREQLLTFVFNMLDFKSSGYISKKIIMEFFAKERFERPLFPFNYVIAVDFLEVERPDRISLSLFLKMEKEMLFLLYPMFRLQSGLREATGGNEYWEKIYGKLFMLELEERSNIRGNEYADQVYRKKHARQQAESRMQDFEKMAKNRKIEESKSIKRDLPPRQRGRRASDSRTNTKLPGRVSPLPRRNRSQILLKSKFEDEVIHTHPQTDKYKVVELRNRTFIKSTHAGGHRKSVRPSITTLNRLKRDTLNDSGISMRGDVLKKRHTLRKTFNQVRSRNTIGSRVMQQELEDSD